MRKTIISALIGAGVLFAPLAADAVGLGKLTVMSGLGQPFRGEIELLALDRAEEGSLSARLASLDAFKEAKIDRSSALAALRFSVEQKKSGEWFIQLTSPQPINDPFLDMLIEVNWPSGRMLREYTVLLDPPSLAVEPQAVAPVEIPLGKTLPGEAAKAVAPASRAEKAPAKKKPEMAAKAEAKPTFEGEAHGDTFGPVKPGQNLSKIASAVKPEGVSLEQMLVSLYRANQQAFAGNNMNRLKTGQILRVPEGGQVAALEKDEAKKEVRAHAADWHAYRQKLAGAVETARPAHEDQARQVGGGKITTATEDKAAGAKEPAKDVLKLSKSESVGGKPGKAVAPEDVIARDKALQEANQRIAELEKNIKDMQRLLEIRSQGMAELQKPESKQPAPPPAAEKAPEAAPVASAPAEQPAEQPKPKPKPKVVTLQATPPAQAPSFLDELLGNPLVLGGGALAALLGGLFGARAIKARRKMGEGKADKGARGGAAGKAMQPGSMPSDILPEVSSALTDFTQSGLGGIDTNEVDPIAEAEVYMAYGRDVQAEEILREAMARDPQRHEIHLKLLEIYSGRKDRGSYEALARQLYAATGGTPDPDWEKAADMGRALDAGNPLYGAAEMPAAPAAVEEPLGEPIDLGEVQAAVDTSPDLDFNLGVGEPPESGTEAVQEGAPSEAAIEELAPDLDFDLGLEEAAPQAEEKTPDADENLLDFNLEVPEPAIAETIPEAAPAAEEAPAEAVEDEHGLNFNLEFPSAASEAEAPLEQPLEQEQPEMPALEEGLASAEAQEFGAGEPSVPETVELEMPELEMPGLDMPGLEMPEPASEEKPEVSFDETMLLNLSDVSAQEPAAPEVPTAEPEPVEAEHESILISPPAMSDEAMLDFDFDIGEETPPPMAPNVDLSGIDLSLSAPATEGEAAAALNLEDAARFQDAATKMDLAKAYMEMGDKEGASEILQEVIVEGSEEQQEDAKKLLAEIG